MSVLVIAEHNHQTVNSATLSAITAAKQLGIVNVLVIGYHCEEVALSLAKVEGVEQVLVIDNHIYQHFLAETLADTIVPLTSHYTHILAAASSFGKNIMPRIAALLDVVQVSDVIAIESTDTFKRPIYAGNAIATLCTTDKIKVLTIRETAFEPAMMAKGNLAPIHTIQTTLTEKTNQLSRFIEQQLCDSERPELNNASVVVAGGRGMQTKENFQLLYALADQLGGAVGATRAAVDAGFAPNDQQIGQTGKIIAPRLYIGVGISGAIQHLAGIMDSKVIVAINKDENAPILEVADYSLVADWQEVLPDLLNRLKMGN